MLLSQDSSPAAARRQPKVTSGLGACGKRRELSKLQLWRIFLVLKKLPGTDFYLSWKKICMFVFDFSRKMKF